MINEKETLKRFGYQSTELTHGMAKTVVRECDICGKLDEIRFNTKCFTKCQKCACGTDDFRERAHNIGKLGKGVPLSPEHRAAIRKAHVGKKESDETKEKKRHAQLGKKHTDAAKKKMSDAKKGKRPPNYGKPHSKNAKKKMSDIKKGKTASKATKKKMSNTHKGKHVGELNCMFGKTGDQSPLWRGGISYLPYCKKFNHKFKESIREKHGRTCFLCPITEEENGRRLSVHHVNYHKDCLCDDILCEFVPLCSTCHGKTGTNRKYWETLIMDKLMGRKQ